MIFKKLSLIKERGFYATRVKIQPSEVLKQELFRMMKARMEGGSDPLDTFVQLSSRYLLQMGIEKEGGGVFREGLLPEGWQEA